MTDMINPVHYKDDPSGVECIEITRYLNFDLGTCFKHLYRAGKKNLVGDILLAEIEDLKKANWYLSDWITNGEVDSFEHGYSPDKYQKIVDTRSGFIQYAMIEMDDYSFKRANLYIHNEITRLEEIYKRQQIVANRLIFG